LHTGDAGTIDTTGFLFLKDRLRDLIYVKGSHVYAADVEEVLRRHHWVKEAVVIGTGDQPNDEEIVAFVVIRSGEKATREELQEKCSSSLADYKLPRRYEFIEELPRDDNGKIRKAELRRRAETPMKARISR
jgi:acyl-CoA synthetase (AMP-forming)/AMP-acid ligase II